MAKTNDELNNDELCDLFTAFDDVSASETLKAATLERVLQGGDDRGFSATEGDASETADAPVFTATAGGASKTSAARKKSGVRSRRRAVRVAAVAACLAFALTGGAAYALPASYVTVTQGGSSIELGVNRFGIAVTASSDDEVGREVVASTDLKNISYEDALARAYDSLAQRSPDEPVNLEVRSDDAGLKAGLEKENEEFMAQRSDVGTGVLEFQQVQQDESGSVGAGGDGGSPPRADGSDVGQPAPQGGDGGDYQDAGGAPPDGGQPGQQSDAQPGGGQLPDR